jgi:hypothetical protein
VKNSEGAFQIVGNLYFCGSNQYKNYKPSAMNDKESFLHQAGQLWDRLHHLESGCNDFYGFEESFEQELNRFSHQTLQGVIGSKRADRREKKTSDAIW